MSVVSARQGLEIILREIGDVLSGVRDAEVENLVHALLGAERIIVCGAGRMGLMARGFAMRLGQLGLRAWYLGDSATPGIGPRDVLVLASGSGETRTIVAVAELGCARGARLALVTARPESTLGRMAEVVVTLPGQAKTDADGPASVQPMTTLNEQCTLLLLDAIVLRLSAATGQTSDDMWARHCNLE